MTTNDIDAIRNRAYLCAARQHRWANEVGVDDQDVIDDLRRAKELATDNVPALCDEIEQLRAELNQMRDQSGRYAHQRNDLAVELEKVRGQYADTRRHNDLLTAELADQQRANTTRANENQRLKRQLADEETQHGNTIDDRDDYQQMADRLAEAIAKLTGVDIGEHSSMNNPWENALQAATERAEVAR